MATSLIGFDSAWSDNPKSPGAICALRIEGDRLAFHPPEPAGFERATRFIQALHAKGDLTLVAIDQPTIVPNQTGMRPVERAIASIISWSGGGIQPAYRDKASMFGDNAPIWRLLTALPFTDDPETASGATHGLFVIEVYPALALLSLDPAFMEAAKCGPRYNPARKTFRQTDWASVISATAREAVRLKLPDVVSWCETLDRATKPKKQTQDQLDSVLCLLIGVLWRRERAGCAIIGDRTSGYIVAPLADSVRERVAKDTRERGVPMA